MAQQFFKFVFRGNIRLLLSILYQDDVFERDSELLKKSDEVAIFFQKIFRLFSQTKNSEFALGKLRPRVQDVWQQQIQPPVVK
jgi:hypothetical protein